MNKIKFLSKLGKVVNENSTTILTATALISVGIVAVTAFYAGRKTKDKTFKESWQYYIPVGLAVVTAGASIVGLNLEYNKRNAALMTVYATSKADNEKLTNKVRELVGLEDKKEDKESSKTVQTPVKDDIYGKEDILDAVTGLTIKNTSKIAVLTAADMVNTAIAEGEHKIRLSEFYDYLGVDARIVPEIAENIIFSTECPMRVEFDGTVVDDIRTITTFRYHYNNMVDEVPWDVR